MRPLCTLLHLLLLPLCLAAQTSTFDQDNEDWTAAGDPVSNSANWAASGGNPGGHISVTDASTGGTWYFVAPQKFRGNKCSAYGKYLRYDQRTNDTTTQQAFGGQPDIRLEGGGLTLIFDNAYNPDLTWTHYDVLLREDAGWHINSLSGPLPTAAQFRSVLAFVSDLRIRGEYRANADIGSLDNVVLESNFLLDLDADDSSGLPGSDFRADTTCSVQSPICDADVLLLSDALLDSLTLRIFPDTVAYALMANALPTSLLLKKTGSSTYALVNLGTASAADFAAALRALIYLDPSARPRRGMRAVLVRAWGECGVLGSASAVLPIFPKPFAGIDGDTLLCPDSPAFALRAVLGGSPEGGGIWVPPLASPGVLDASRDAPGLYTYLLPPAGRCPGDTAIALVDIDAVPALPPDTVLCRGEVLRLSVPPGLKQWTWTPGGTVPEVEATEAGQWVLEGSTGLCDFRDEVELRFFNCQPCEVYAPNAFAPTRYGLNESWQIFSSCLWQSWSLSVYDRWGGLVFFSHDPEVPWTGMTGGREAPAGVYLWHLRAWGELRGAPRLYESSGDVTLLR